MVKRLRHRPFTAVTRVRFPLESLWRHSQVVRHGSATPLSSVQIRLSPLIYSLKLLEIKEFFIYKNKYERGSCMSKGIGGKNNWALFLLLLAGIVLGGFIGELTSGVAGLSWLNYGQSFGFSNPIVLNLGILVITFGLTIKITIASIVGVVLAIIIYRLL